MADYKTILLAAGFTQIKGCSCGGVRQDKFKLNDYQVYVKIRALTFRIKKGNTFLTHSKPITYLNETLAATLNGVN